VPGSRGDRRDLLGPQARGPAALSLDQRFAVHERDARVSTTRCSNGTASAKRARGALGRDPASGETMQIAASRAAKFSAAAALKKQLNS
jgi:hypothetical protein